MPEKVALNVQLIFSRLLNRAIVADPYLEKYRGRENLLLQFLRLWDGRLNLEPLGANPDIEDFKKWFAQRQDGAWDEMIQSLCEVHQLWNDLGRSCLLHVRRHALLHDPGKDGEAPVEELSLKTRLEYPELFYQAYDRHTFQKAERFSVFLAPKAGAIRDLPGALKQLEQKLTQAFQADPDSARIRVRHYTEHGYNHFTVYHDRPVDAEFVLHEKRPRVMDSHLYYLSRRDLLIYHGAQGQLEIEASSPKEEPTILRLFAEACLGDPAIFDHSPARTCFHLSRLAEPDFIMPTEHGDQAFLTEIHFHVHSANELDKEEESFAVRGHDVLRLLNRYGLRESMAPSTVRRVVFRFHFSSSRRDRSVMILDGNKISFKRARHQDDVYHYLRKWGVMA